MTSVARLSRLLDLLSQDPRNPSLLAEIADQQLQLADWAAAKSTLTQLLELQPGDPLSRYRLAVAERHGNDAARARSLLQDLVDQGHSHPAILQELARSHAQLGDWGLVIPTLISLNASELPPQECDAVRLLRLRAHHRLGDLEDAVAEARAWQTERGLDVPLQGQAAIATLLLDAQLLDEAEQLLSSVDADVVNSHAELATANGYVELGSGQLDGALEHFAKSTQLEPQLGRAHLGRGLALATKGDVQQAIEALKTAVSVTPEHLGSWHTLAWMQLLAKDIDGAAASFEAALVRDPNFGETHGGLGLIAALRGDKQVSERYLRTALKLDSSSMNVMVARTVLERGSGSLDEPVLSQALDLVMRLATKRNPAMKTILTKMVGGSR
ncbi:tetratricopeptide repeat protein [Roseateles sp. NT4]|uniref:tetratricopeptide repeat protein n=1 Tax=Roseateles sp. NT4 TaxID=3453715 RepID=UPI003EEBF3EA